MGGGGFGPGHPVMLAALARLVDVLNVGLLGVTLGQALLAAEAAVEAVPLLHDSLVILERLVPEDVNTVTCAMLLATAIVKAKGEPAVARAVLERTSERVRQSAGEHSPLLASLAELSAKLGLVGS